VKDRLDRVLAARGLAENRTQAQALILAGKVYSGARRLDKAGHAVGPETPLEVRGRPHPWVSRGGLKLEHGLRVVGGPAEGRLGQAKHAAIKSAVELLAVVVEVELMHGAQRSVFHGVEDGGGLLELVGP